MRDSAPIARRRSLLNSLSKNRDVGVDVECLPYDGPCLQVADQFYSPIEVSTLRSLRSSERALRFIQYWTLKESFIKARGVGLAAPLDEFSFSIEEAPTKRTEIRLDPSLEDDPERWQFNLDDIGEEYIVATAIERRRDEKIHLVRREVLHTTAPPAASFEGTKSRPGNGSKSRASGLNLS